MRNKEVKIMINLDSFKLYFNSIEIKRVYDSVGGFTIKFLKDDGIICEKEFSLDLRD